VRPVDLTGRRVGRWAVLRRNGSTSNGNAAWHCRCDCGNERTVASTSLVEAVSLSCGCLAIERTREANATHGESKKTPEYETWVGIKKRCTNSRTKAWKYYGGRGITMCDRWFSSYENFLADMGRKPTPKHSIDRINNDGNYEPGNCRWATSLQQNNNRSDNKKEREDNGSIAP
jgi:hypothetical protein